MTTASLALEAYRSVVRCGVLETALRILRRCGALQAVYSLDFFITPALQTSCDDRIEVEGNALGFHEIAPEAFVTGGYRIAEGLPDVSEFEVTHAGGSSAFAAISGYAVVGLVWMNPHVARLGFIGKPEVALPSGFVYIHGAVVAPEFRGHGIGAELKKFAMSRMSAGSARHFVSAVYLENEAGQRWHREILRERYCGRITLVHLRNQRYWLSSNTCRRDGCGTFLDAVLAENDR